MCCRTLAQARRAAGFLMVHGTDQHSWALPMQHTRPACMWRGRCAVLLHLNNTAGPTADQRPYVSGLQVPMPRLQRQTACLVCTTRPVPRPWLSRGEGLLAVHRQHAL